MNCHKWVKWLWGLKFSMFWHFPGRKMRAYGNENKWLHLLYVRQATTDHRIIKRVQYSLYDKAWIVNAVRGNMGTKAHCLSLLCLRGNVFFFYSIGNIRHCFIRSLMRDKKSLYFCLHFRSAFNLSRLKWTRELEFPCKMETSTQFCRLKNLLPRCFPSRE